MEKSVLMKLKIAREPVTDLDLLACYQAYPRKRGKSPGLKAAKRVIKTQDDLVAFRHAIENYKKVIAYDETEPQFVMYFSTFVSQWDDFLDDEVLSSVAVPDYASKIEGAK